MPGFGAPFPGGDPNVESVRFALLAALDRLQTATRADDAVAYAAAGETLFWACALDEMCEEVWKIPGYTSERPASVDGRISPGLRWARNGVAHANSILFVGAVVSAPPNRPAYYEPRTRHFIARSRTSSPPFHNLYWLDTKQVTRPPDNDKGKDVYDKYLSGVDVQDAINKLRAWFLD